MSAPMPGGWSEPDKNGTVRWHAMGMRASVRRMTDGPDRGSWLFWVELVNGHGHTKETARGVRPRRYQAASVAMAVVTAIGAQK